MATATKELSIALGLDEKGFVDGAKKAEAAAKGFEKELEAVEQAAREADAALAKVDSAALPELTQKAGEAKFRMQELEAATQALAKAGGTIPSGVTSKIQDLGSKLDDAAARGEKFKRSLEATTQQAKGAGNIFEGTSLAGSKLGGTLGGMTGSLEKMASVGGRLGPIIAAITATFAGAVAIGTKLRENWDKIFTAMDRIAPGAKKLADAMKSMGQSIIDSMTKVITGVDGAGDAFDRTGAKVQSNLAKMARAKDALEGVNQALGAVVPEVLEYAAAQQKAADQTKAWEDALNRVGKIQGADYGKFVRDSALALTDWYDKLSDSNKALAEQNPKVAEAIKQAKEFLAAQGQLSKGVGDTTQAIKDQAAAADEATRSMARWGDALRGAAAAGAESTESIKARAAAEAERAAANTQSVLDRMKAEDEERDKKNAEAQAQKEAADLERRIAAEQRLTDAINARNASLAESEARIAAQNEALRQMAVAVESVNSSIYDSLPGMRQMFDEVSRIADTKLYGGYIKEIFNSFADGTRTLAQTHAALSEVRLGLDRIGAMGGGWLGDVLTEISDLTTRLNRAADAAKQAKRDAMWDNSGEDQGPAGEDRTQGFAAGRSAGGFGRLTAELNRTRNP